MSYTNRPNLDFYNYLAGIGNHHQSEALLSSLPVGCNSPQKPPHGSYAEKLSGTAFTAPRHENRQTWLYRALPSCVHRPFGGGPRTRCFYQGSYFKGLPRRWDLLGSQHELEIAFVKQGANKIDSDLKFLEFYYKKSTSFSFPYRDYRSTEAYRGPEQLRWDPYEPYHPELRNVQYGLMCCNGTWSLDTYPPQYVPDDIDDGCPRAKAYLFDWVSGLHLAAKHGLPAENRGLAIYNYYVTMDMPERCAFYNADGEMLIVAQCGTLIIKSELGILRVSPGEICVMPRGIRYHVSLEDKERYEDDQDTHPDTPTTDDEDYIPVEPPRNSAGQVFARGYVLELYEGHFQLPELGPIGSQGLANVGDFKVPTARFDREVDDNYERQHKANYKTVEIMEWARREQVEEEEEKEEPVFRENEFAIWCKYNDRLHEALQDYTCFDVIAWKGTYYPYKYDLGKFNTMGSISYDHPDPSIFTVLTAPSARLGTAIADFVVFPPRWLVGEGTFRPPYYHRNCMTEFMGMIRGEYDGKAQGFLPGGASLHPPFSGHGPDAATFERAAHEDDTSKPVKVGEQSLAFMFETSLTLSVPADMYERAQPDYVESSWGGLKLLTE